MKIQLLKEFVKFQDFTCKGGIYIEHCSKNAMTMVRLVKELSFLYTKCLFKYA